MNIEIITTSNSDLKETGFGPMLACNDVCESLTLLGHSVLTTECASLVDLNNVVLRSPDLVVLAAKYLSVENGDDIWFSEYFSDNSMTFSGSNRETLKYDSDKALAKVHLSSLGVNTAKHFIAIPGQFTILDDLPLKFPLFVKPMDAANGNGIDDQSFVQSFKEFDEKVIALFNIYKQPVLVEEYLGGREFTVAVIMSDNGNMSVSAIELIPPVSTKTLRILGAEVKKFDTESIEEVSKIDIEAVMKIAELSFRALGIRGFGRIDIKMDDSGICYFMEANLVPGMNKSTSYFPRACAIANKLSYNDVVQEMFSESFGRVATKKQTTKLFPQAAPTLVATAV